MISLKNLAEQRVNFLGSNVVLGKLRVTTDPPSGAVLEAGIWPNRSNDETRWTNNAVTVRLEGEVSGDSSTYHATRIIRGLPGNAVRDGDSQRPVYDPKLWDLFLAWLNLLRPLGFCFKASSHAGSWTPIISLDDYFIGDTNVSGEPVPGTTLPPSQSRIVLVTLTDARIPQAGSDGMWPPSIQVKGVESIERQSFEGTRINGIHEVIDLPTQAVVIAGQLPTDAQWVSTGKLRPLMSVHVPILRYQITGFGTRRTGGRSSYKGILVSGPFVDTLPIAVGAANALPQPTRPVLTPQGIPAENTYRNAREIAVEVWKGYDVNPQDEKFPLGITQATNVDDLWVLFISGTDLTQNATGIPEDIQAAQNEPDYFSGWVYVWVNSVVPKGASLLICGHSLGGMVGQNVIPRLNNAGYVTRWLTVYGGPVTIWQPSYVNRVMWLLNIDVVPNVTGWGLAYGYVGHPEQIHLNDPSIPSDIVSSHLDYPKCQLLNAYDPWGYPLPEGQSKDLNTGPVRRFKIPAGPPPGM